jgi:hypothetical protein
LTVEGIGSETGVNSFTEELIDETFNGPVIGILLIARKVIVSGNGTNDELGWTSRRMISNVLLVSDKLKSDNLIRSVLERECWALEEKVNYVAESGFGVNSRTRKVE